VSTDRTLAHSVLSPSVGAVAATAKAKGQSLRLTVATGVSLEVRISHVGRDFVAGSLETPEGVTVIIPSVSIVVLDGDGLLMDDGETAFPSPARSHLRALLANSQRLSHRVIVHTAVGHHSGVIRTVAGDAVVMSLPSTQQRLVLISHIVWISVLGN
jgi:hypothetical protein